MKVLLRIDRDINYKLLVSLPTQRSVEELMGLVNREQYSQAILSALTNGSFERAIEDHEVLHTKADLILSEHSVCWDLTNG